MDTICISRGQANTLYAIARSETQCRTDLDACRHERADLVNPSGGGGWDPLTVVLVSGGAVIVVGGIAFLAGYLAGG